MSIAELTKKIETLSSDDYNIVITLVNRLAANSEVPTFPKLSEKELIDEMIESISNSNQGKTKPAKEVSKNMRDKYAF